MPKIVGVDDLSTNLFQDFLRTAEVAFKEVAEPRDKPRHASANDHRQRAALPSPMGVRRGTRLVVMRWTAPARVGCRRKAYPPDLFGVTETEDGCSG